MRTVLALLALLLKLDDAPWKYEDPEIRAREAQRDNRRFKLFNGGVQQLEECPQCWALVREEKLTAHVDTHSDAGDTE